MNILVNNKKINIAIAISILAVLGVLVLAANAAEIHGVKWNDSNGNATKDPEELGVHNVTICYYSNSSPPSYPGICTITDQDGNYSFLNIENGTYRIYEIIPPSKVAIYPIAFQDQDSLHSFGGSCNWCHSFLNATAYIFSKVGWHEVTVEDSDIKTDINFGNANPSEIRGTKFNDSNSNGTRDPGELGMGGVRISLKRILSPGNEIQFGNTRTDTNGGYNFTNLSAGYYKIEETGLFGFSQTYPASGAPHYINLGVGETISGMDFGNWPAPPGNISGRKFNDSNGNGIQDAGEAGIAGINIMLYPSSRSVSANSNGDYLFTNVSVGRYIVYEALTQEYTNTTARYVSVQVNSNDTSVVNFGNRRLIPPPPDVSILQAAGNQNGIPIAYRGLTTLSVRKNLSDVSNVLGVNLTLYWVSYGTTKTADMVQIGTTGVWEATLSGPFSSGTARMTFKVDVAPAGPSDLDIIQIGDIRFIDPSGQIRSSCDDKPISGAEATLFVEFPPTTGNFIESPPENQLEPNPQTTLENGYFGWMTTLGTYKVKAIKAGYDPNESEPVFVPPPRTGLDILLTPISGCPPPPVFQNLGLPDTQMPNVSVDLCQGCHPGAPDVHHYMVSGGPQSGFIPTTTLGCLDCHPIVGGKLTISRNCHDCHDGTAWTINPIINLTAIRGAPGRPHHNTTKNSASSTFQAAYRAINRQCTFCHGDGYLDNYNDGHATPTYNTSMITPMADFKINKTIGNGRVYGGCEACHDAGKDGAIETYNNHDTHHYETTSMLGRQCNYCHVSSGFRAEPIPDFSSDPNANPLRVWLNASYPIQFAMFKWDNSMLHVEFRNNTIMTWMNDPINGTGCGKCHSVRDMHNIQTASPGRTLAQTLADEIPGYGHIGNNSDCNGCHQGWAGAVTNPFPGPKAMSIDSVSPGVLTANVATDVTITGSNFVEDPYTTTVLVDDVSTVPKSITETEIVVAVNLAAGVHSIVVQKDVATTALTTVIAIKPGTITSAKLAGTTVTIDGAGLGAGQTMVVIVKSDGTRKASDSITSSTDTQIVAVASQAAVSDTVEVVTPTGKATATIEAGEVLDSVTVTVPNGGESWQHGTTQTITWNHVGSSEAQNVKIELWKGNERDRTIVSRTTNDGSYDWAIRSDQSPRTNYRIKIISVEHTPSYSDISDSYFTIVT